jgi:HlyD family secretion protein
MTEATRSNAGVWAAIGGLVLGGIGLFVVPRRSADVRFARSPVASERLAAPITLRLPGRLAAKTTVRIGAASGGQVTKVQVAVGDHVTRGQVLARLDDLEQRRKVDVERALLELAQIRGFQAEKRFVELIRSLQGDVFVPDDVSVDRITAGELGDAQLGVLATSTQISAQKGMLALSREALARRLVRAPVDGIVVAAGVASGETVGPSPPAPPLFVIGAEPEHLVLRVEVDQGSCARIGPGPASFRVAALGSRVFEGTIAPESAGPSVPASSVRREVLIDVDNGDLALRPGMTAIVSLPLTSPPPSMGRAP